MHSRLVLGCGSLGQALVQALTDRPGDLFVVDSDEQHVTTLREEGIAAEHADPTDADAIASLAGDPDTVLVAADSASTNESAVRVARRAFPDALLVAYTGKNPTVGSTAVIESVADEVVDASRATTSFLLERVGESGVRTRKLTSALRAIDGKLAVVTHDNPDPDAIASAVALQRIARNVGLDVDICYYGNVTHQENRAFINLLDFDLRNLEPDSDLSEYDGFALVDHSRPGVNDQLPSDVNVDIVVDHHPPRAPVEAKFVDLRSDVGATSTLFVEYLRHLGIALDEAVATGLLFGIRVDTKEFSREVSPQDFEAAAYLLPHADLGTLERIESPSMSADTLDTIARAIRNRDRHGSVLVSSVGRLSDRDALAQAADRLLDLEDVTTTFVYGIKEGTIYASARARGTDIDLGETLREAFGQIGSAGGHADMAGAQISLGLLEDIDESNESLVEVVRDVVDERFFEALESHSHHTITDFYPDDLTPEAALGGTAIDVETLLEGENGDDRSEKGDRDSENDDEPADDGNTEPP